MWSTIQRRLECCLRRQPFAAHPMAAQASSLGLQLLWKRTPIAWPSPEVHHRKWLLIATEPAGPPAIFEESSYAAATWRPEIEKVILKDAGTAAEGMSFMDSARQGTRMLPAMRKSCRL